MRTIIFGILALQFVQEIMEVRKIGLIGIYFEVGTLIVNLERLISISNVIYQKTVEYEDDIKQ